MSPSLSKVYPRQEQHDPADLNRAREIASITDPIPVGVLYRNEDAPRYDELRQINAMMAPESIRAAVEEEMDKFTIWPTE
jgi:2-oxoglutarate ferredoxin oxidoreductase subunit beta